MADESRRETMRVGLLQTDPVLGDVDGNLARLETAVARAADADLIVTPELATHGYNLGGIGTPTGLAPADQRLIGLSRHCPVVVAGFAESFRHHLFNSAAVITNGAARVQRKLYPVTYRTWEEGKHFRPGNRILCHDVAGTRLAVIICNDLWQPPVPWLAAHAGAEVLVVIANSATSEVGVSTERAWELLLMHTAVTLQSFVVFVNRSGQESGQTYWGGSRVIHPSGSVVGELGAGVDELGCELNLADVRNVRRQWPLLQASRADMVAREAARLAALEQEL